MINWSSVNEMQNKKLNLQLQLSNLLNSKDVTKDRINELNSEIKHLDLEISKILGTKEIKRMEELKKKKSGIEERNLKRFYNLKDKYKKISKLNVATNHILSKIDNTYIEEQIVKVK